MSTLLNWLLEKAFGPAPEPSLTPTLPTIHEDLEHEAVPQVSEAPAVPEASVVPEAPEVPTVPEPPEVPAAPEASEATEVPTVPEVPAVPEAPETSAPELTLEQSEIALQGIQVPFECAHQYGYIHSYKPKPWKPHTIYMYDGVNVFCDGQPIGDDVLAKNAHYGHMGEPGPYENMPVRKIVQEKYFLHFSRCRMARALNLPVPPMPEPVAFYVTYCGN